ncbi:putative protein N(5)-glutamine methyltransferase [Cellulomonas gilvus]|uniref:peptide chain release factor N(5)-glutamine methyltransferase n=1 Tax=Cellulomonas gilvus (strain ATCC 13127 / NRRL B-14078) TaxID=593907 RepID=F8A6T9_CELGA|nr:putative protein N(5)-glutamine methyltransferase [Cellulomonas gilvus]AEI12293.1 modification methylase, HemK family [Cellulomonas gilvus ATCC 13127]
MVDACGSHEALAARLRATGSVFAEDEATLLLQHAAAAPCSPDELETLVARRCAGEPLELVVGWASFGGVRVTVAPGVFVPRQRTTLLVGLAEGVLRDEPRGAAPVVVDLCCGTGAVGAALLARLPGLDLHAADLDPDAVACARRNLPADRVHQGDLLEALPTALRGRVDVVVANAPYVPTDAIGTMPPEAREHEHHVALDGGDDGLAVHRRIAQTVRPWLAAGGVVLIETSVRQAPATAALLHAVGLATRVVHDEDVDGTVVVAHVPTEPERRATV